MILVMILHCTKHLSFCGVEVVIPSYFLMMVTNVSHLLASSPAGKSSSPGSGLTDILVRQLVIQAYSLWLMFNRLSVHDGVLELVDNGLVDLVTAAKESQYRVLY